METNGKKTLAVIIAAVVVLFAVAAVVYRRVLNDQEGGVVSENNAAASVPEVYSPEVPKNAELTPTVIEGLVNPSAKSGPKTRVFEVLASKIGYTPSEIVVNLGDTVGITIKALDGDHDFDLPAIGLYQYVKQGEQRSMSFLAAKTGTFFYTCRDHCPGDAKISGKFIVKE